MTRLTKMLLCACAGMLISGGVVGAELEEHDRASYPEPVATAAQPYIAGQELAEHEWPESEPAACSGYGVPEVECERV